MPAARFIVTLPNTLADFLALRRNTTLLLGALVLAGTGERLWLGFAPKYLETLGATVLVIGRFDALQTMLGAVYAYPGGWLTDRWGQRRSLLLFNVLSPQANFLGAAVCGAVGTLWFCCFVFRRPATPAIKEGYPS
jgi:MFS family permease